MRMLFSHDTFNEHIDPFLLLRYTSSISFSPGREPRGVAPHPCRGFEIVTLVFEGEVEYCDSTREATLLTPGDVQWTTAASGIMQGARHSQGFTARGGPLEMAQLWVNLPARDKMSAPGGQTIRFRDMPVVDLPGEAGEVRIVAGDHYGHKGAAGTFTPLNVWDLRLKNGRRTALTLPEGHTLCVVVLSGCVEINCERQLGAVDFALLSRTGGAITLEALSEAKILILSGAPIDEPVAAHGPIVMNSADEIERAIADFGAGAYHR